MSVRRSLKHFLPSHQSPSRCLHRPSWGIDQEDQSSAQGKMRHQPHRQWRGGGYEEVNCCSCSASMFNGILT
jgi:hypothetical protein